MSNYSVFDIAGPIMTGPSSSHTAGAVKLGQMARALFDSTPDEVQYLLHGSFGTVYKGHATDRALLAGVMKMYTSDARIKDAFNIADEKGIKYKFTVGDLGLGYHPNSVKITLKKGNRKMSMTGSSTGGGNVNISQIDDFNVDFKGIAGKYFTIVISHKNQVGILSYITTFISERGINIANMQSSRVAEGGKALTIANLDTAVGLPDILELEKLPGIHFVRSLTKVT
ncbi:MAG: L-serine ammonia-lyase, iron-sulfur-dependent subunit beta [Patescibacteria group bacterium]|nr:L-serine ammonia-lyase, iron-sulfur-dependent subunit beta [Patescibacteria group bacterium]